MSCKGVVYFIMLNTLQTKLLLTKINCHKYMQHAVVNLRTYSA